MAAGRVIWSTLVGLYDETLGLLKANLVWFLLSLPLGLPLLIGLSVAVPAVEDEGSGGLVLPLMLTGLLLLLVPNPASLGLYGMAATMQRRESPRWGEFWSGARQNLGLGLKLYALGLFGIIVLGVNANFYLHVEQSPLQALSLLWAYLGLFWLCLQLYIGPLVMYLGERRLVAIYRRAALLVLAHPIYSITFLFMDALLVLLCLIVVPLYPALAMAFVALLGTRALGQLKRKYDPDPSGDEETA